MNQPLPRMLQPLLLTLARASEKQLARYVEYLREENRQLRSRIEGPIKLTPRERNRLIKYGLPLGPELKKVITIVRYDTFLKWVRTPTRPRPYAKVGRPRKPEELRQLVVRMGKETGWGVNRILGELKKLGIESISRTTVRNILREHGLGPGPERAESTWEEWLEAHAETLWACDFFSKRILTRTGIKTAYALVFLNVKARRVIVSPSTVHPTREWSSFQAEAFMQEARHRGLPSPTVLIRDGDGKFGARFNEALRAWGCEPKRIPPGAPNLNALVERWVKSVKVECLDRFVVLGTDYFDHLVEEFVAHYHEERPHQGIDNQLSLRRGPPAGEGAISCSSRLGGVLKAYHRVAA